MKKLKWFKKAFITERCAVKSHLIVVHILSLNKNKLHSVSLTILSTNWDQMYKNPLFKFKLKAELKLS